MYYLSQFSNTEERKKNKIISTSSSLLQNATSGAGTGILVTSMLPFRSKRVDKILQSPYIEKIPLYGKPIRDMAIKGSSKNPLGTRISKNPASHVIAGLIGAGLGAGYGAYKLLKNRKKNSP